MGNPQRVIMSRQKGLTIKDLWVPLRKKYKDSNAKYIVNYWDKDKEKKDQRILKNLSYDAHTKAWYWTDWRQKARTEGRKPVRKEYVIHRGAGDKEWEKATFHYMQLTEREQGAIQLIKPSIDVIKPDIINKKEKQKMGIVDWIELSETQIPIYDTDEICINLAPSEICQLWREMYLKDPQTTAKLTEIEALGNDYLIKQIVDYTPNQKVKIEDIIQIYINHKELKLRSSQRNNNKKYMNHFADFCKAKYIHEIDETKIIKYKNMLKKEAENGEKITQNNLYVNKYTIGIKAVLNFYLKNYIELAQNYDLDSKEIARKKVEEVKKVHGLTTCILPKLKREKVKDKPEPIRPNAFSRLIKKGINKGDKQGLLMALLLSNGGLYNMDMEDIRVSHLKTSFDVNGHQFYYLDFPRGKNDVDRITVLWEITHTLLTEQIQNNTDRGLYDGIEHDKDKAIFFTLNKKKPKPAKENNTRYIFNKCFGRDNLHDNGVKLGIRHFRDTVKRVCKDANIDRTYIRTAIGHSQGDSMMDDCYDNVVPVDMIVVKECMYSYYSEGLALLEAFLNS